MPTTRIDYVDQPYVGRRYTPDTRSLAALLLRAGENEARGRRQQGSQSAALWQSLGETFRQAQAEAVAQRQMKEAAAVRASERMAAEKLERDQMAAKALHESQVLEMQQQQLANEQARRQQDLDIGAAREASETTVPGPIDEFTAAVMAKFPGTAARLRKTQTLPATPMSGEMAPPSAMTVLEPTPVQLRQQGQDLAAREQANRMQADRQVDNARQAQALDLQARGLAQSDRHQRAMEARQPRDYADAVVQGPNGPVLVDKATGVARPVTTGSGEALGPASSSAERLEAKKRLRSEGVVEAIDALSEKINTGAGLMAKAVGAAEKVAAKANYDDDVAEYLAIIEAATPLVARAWGHIGMLTQLDVDSSKALFPKPGDSKTLRDRKMTRLKSLVTEASGPARGQTARPASSQLDPSGVVQMVAPDGRLLSVPAGDVAEAERLGAKRKP